MGKTYKNKILKTKIGKLIKYVNFKSKFYKKFGEIYFNQITKSKIKNDWILHKKYQCLILVISGIVKFTLKEKKKLKFII